MSENSSKKKLRYLSDVFRGEVKRTFHLGKKLMWASWTNGNLNESYQELGRFIYEEVKKKNLSAEDLKISDYINKIDEYIKSLEVYEEELQDIKKQNYNNHEED